MNRSLLSASSLALAVVLLLAVNILSGVLFQGARIDLTADRLYTLTDGTKQVLDELQDEITLNYYFSAEMLRDVPNIKSYAVRVEELLNEYVNRADGRLRLNVVDPEPFSDAEDRAVRFGLRGVPVNDVGEVAYFGMAGVNTTDGEEVIPFFHPGSEDTLEYEITRLIYNLDRPGKKVVGIIGSLPLDGRAAQMPPNAQPGPTWTVLSQMREVFDVRMLREKNLDSIPADIDLLMLAHPRELTDRTLYAIDQFVLRGGRVLAFLDPYSDAEPLTRDPFVQSMTTPKLPSDLGPLPAAWGFRIDPDFLIGDADMARQVATSQNPADPPVDYLLWLEVPKEQLDTEDVITQRLTTLSLGTSGAIEALPDAATQLLPLVRSTPNAMRVATAELQTKTRPDFEALLANFAPAGEPFFLGARVSGTVATAFAGGPPDGYAGTDEHRSTSDGPVNLVVFADSDILADRFWVRVQDFFGDRTLFPFADNGALVINALDNLSGSSALISVRSRASYARPFERVREIRRNAEAQYRAKEEELQRELLQTDQRLRELQKPAAEGVESYLTPEQQAEIERFVEEKVRIRRELREVQHDLRKDIDHLEARLRFANIGLVPLVIGLMAVVAGLARTRRRRIGTA